MSLEEEDSIRQFTEGLKFDGDRYEVPLLWKSDAPQVPNLPALYNPNWFSSSSLFVWT